MTYTTDALTTLMQTHGLQVLFPLAVLEGPIVTVLAGWLARIGYLPLVPTLLMLILADLTGDLLLYSIGRSGLGIVPPRWRDRLGLRSDRLERVGAHFRERGGQTLVIAKLTHSLGFAALVSAGVARMPVAPFLWFNLLGTIPKSAFLLAIGYAVGQAHVAFDAWIGRGSLVLGVVAVAILVVWVGRRKWRRS